eukprot:TRINITY_DN11666_c0_g1_i1.p1 TRINITY_DN11666_c0_g1~~TRINITY_DN11666_c0_g1_i1.p1  ORF type:complete len:363 (+),score=80.33 TRINITY_DN11666_c0_g1_i1:26-1114(+)
MAAINDDFEAKLQFLKEVLTEVPISDLRDRLQIALDKNQTVDHVIDELMNSQDYHPAPEKKSQKIEVDLVSDEPIHWGNDNAVEDNDFKLAMQLYEQELREQYNPNKHIADVHQSRIEQQKVISNASTAVNENKNDTMQSQLQDIRKLQEQRYKQQRSGAPSKPRDTSKPILPQMNIYGQLNEARRRHKDKWRGNNLEQKQVWTINDLSNKSKFEEDTKAGGWIGANKKLNENSKDADEIGRLALEYTNKFREAHKLPALKWHQTLANIGFVHSKDMGEGQVPFSHQGFDARVKQMPGPMSAAENLAMNIGHSNVARTAVDGWINSPGHRRNLLASHEYCGIGVYRNSVGKWYLTQLFMRTN